MTFTNLLRPVTRTAGTVVASAGLLTGVLGMTPAHRVPAAHSPYIARVTASVYGRTVTAQAVSRYPVAYNFRVETTAGRWELGRGYGPSPMYTVPAGVVRVQAGAVTTYEQAHHDWGSRVASPVVPVPQYPSLAAMVAHEPVASLAQVRAALKAGDAEALGFMRWSKADAYLVLHTWGPRKAPAKITTEYALMFLYAALANNSSVFNSPAGILWGTPITPESFPWAPHIGFAPNNVSQVDLITTLLVHDKGVDYSDSPNYEYKVTYTTTTGAVLTQWFNTALYPDHSNPTRYWVLDASGWMGNTPTVRS